MAAIGEALREATRHLAGGGGAARLEAEILLGHVLARPRAWLLARSDRPLTPVEHQRFKALIGRRLEGHPIAYLAERREFWSRTFRVTPAALIPRPETEHLIEAALERIPPAAHWRIADLGTGSGAIAVTLGLERPGCRVVATDISAEALELARENAQRLGAANIEFHRADWLSGFGGAGFDLIASNPPYIPPGDPHLGEGDLRFEPALALVAEERGLAALRIIADQARDHLRPGGWLIVEHGHDQGMAVAELLRGHGYSALEARTDVAGLPRLAMGRFGA